MTINEKIKQIRTAAGMSQRQFATATKTPYGTLRKYEGTRTPSITFLSRLREKFGTDINQLIQ